MGKKTARYRRARDDRYGHPKTGGMKLQAYGLFDYAVAQNLLGVLQQSPRAIAARFGNTLAEVNEAIKILTTPRNDRAPIARWWPDLETLWIVEALDEQSDGGKADVAARKQLAALPTTVQSAIVERYGMRLSGNGGVEGGGDTPSGGLFLPGNREQVTGNSEQESGSPRTPASGGSSRRGKVEPNPDDIAVLDAVDEARVRQGLDPMSPEARVTGTIAKRRKLGATQAQLLEQVGVFERLAERDPSKRTLLCATTPFTAPGAGGGKGGWQWGRDMLDEERVLELRSRRVRAESGGRRLDDVDDVLAAREGGGAA
jgi:hypothetical protein